MVRRVRDGRFGERPHYKPEELDDECESIIVSFLRKIHDSDLSSFETAIKGSIT